MTGRSVRVVAEDNVEHLIVDLDGGALESQSPERRRWSGVPHARLDEFTELDAFQVVVSQTCSHVDTKYSSRSRLSSS